MGKKDSAQLVVQTHPVSTDTRHGARTMLSPVYLALTTVIFYQHILNTDAASGSLVDIHELVNLKVLNVFEESSAQKEDISMDAALIIFKESVSPRGWGEWEPWTYCDGDFCGHGKRSRLRRLL